MSVKSRTLDLLTEHRFHLYDIKPVMGLYPFVFDPGLGFSAISAPDLTAEMFTITPGNAVFPHKVIKRGQQNTLTLQRGAFLHDGEMWKWFIAALTGDAGSTFSLYGGRRNLLLAHFSMAEEAQWLKNYRAVKDRNAGLLAKAGAFAALTSLPMYAYLGSVPSRCWILYDCLPSRYRAASDFNAKGAEVSFREMGLEYADIDEIPLGKITDWSTYVP